MSEIAKRHDKRLRELEKLGLAYRRNDWRWSVGLEPRSKLRAKDKAEPKARPVVERQRMTIREQIRHLGGVWLDRIRAEGLAPSGFGTQTVTMSRNQGGRTELRRTDRDRGCA
jgi:hypothetical protein